MNCWKRYQNSRNWCENIFGEYMKCLLTSEIQSLSCVITNATGNSKFEITDTKLYEPVVSLSTKNSRLVQVFIKSNCTSSKLYRNILITPGFQGVNWLYVLSFENENDRNIHYIYISIYILYIYIYIYILYIYIYIYRYIYN